MRTRAAVLRQRIERPDYADRQPLEVATVHLEPPGAGEVLVRIEAAGLCHSDLSVINGDRPRPTPMVLGHEACGVVVGTGPGVDDPALRYLRHVRRRTTRAVSARRHDDRRR